MTNQAPPQHEKIPLNLGHAAIKDGCALGVAYIRHDAAMQKTFIQNVYQKGKKRRRFLAVTSAFLGAVTAGFFNDPVVGMNFAIAAASFVAYGWLQAANQTFSQKAIGKRLEKFQESYDAFHQAPSLQNKELVDQKLDNLQSKLTYKHKEIDTVDKIGVGIATASSLALTAQGQNSALGVVGLVWTTFGPLSKNLKQTKDNAELLGGLAENKEIFSENLMNAQKTAPVGYASSRNTP